MFLYNELLSLSCRFSFQCTRFPDQFPVRIQRFLYFGLYQNFNENVFKISDVFITFHGNGKHLFHSAGMKIPPKLVL